jgi:hypothetical protein
MITIANFETAESAHLFRMFLQARGIEASLLDEHLVQLCWHYSVAIGGVRVVLHDPDDRDEAIAAREEYFAAISSNPSLVAIVRGWPIVLLLSWFMGGPLLVFGRKHLNGPATQDGPLPG